MEWGVKGFFLLPLWEKVARTKSVPDEGFTSAERDPSPVSHLTMRATLSHKGRGEVRPSLTPSAVHRRFP
jgi:hypothetical protein